MSPVPAARDAAGVDVNAVTEAVLTASRLLMAVSARSIANVAAVSSNSGGGFIDVGDSRSDGEIDNNVSTTIASGVNLVAGNVGGGVLTTPNGVAVVVADADPGESFAVIHPHSIAVVRGAVNGSSVRNTFAGVVADLDRLGDRVRVSIEGPLPLTAEITVAAMEALELRPGDDVHASVKATDIEVYPA